MRKRLNELKINESGMITGIGSISASQYNRFMDVGISLYSRVKLLKTLNFSRLFIIEVDDVEICIRRKDAAEILIET